MPLETGTYISDLVETNPAGTDPKSQGDNHLRLLKATIKTSFPNITGAVTPTHTELNYVDGVTSPIQTQIDSKGAHAGQTWTGAHDFTGATITVPTASPGDNTDNGASTAFVAAGLALKGSLAGATWTGAQDFTGATITAPTPATSDDSNKVATTEYVNNVATNAALPSQGGNAGKYLKTDGTDAEWEDPQASQNEAEAGAVSDRLMTPLRTAQAIAALSKSAPDIIIQDQKTSGTNGGANSGGTSAWERRVLNTVERNDGSYASLSSNQVTLQAGVYLLRARAAFGGGSQDRLCRIRLYNATDAAVVAYSEPAMAYGDGSITAEAVAVVTITSGKAFEIDAWGASINSAGQAGWGRAVGTGAAEVYATFEATRLRSA